MRKYKMLLLSVLMTIFIFSVLSGCGKSDNKNIYKIYYVNPAHSDFVTRNYKTESEDVTKLIKELYDEMRKSPNENSVSVIPDNIILNAYYIENNVLNKEIIFHSITIIVVTYTNKNINKINSIFNILFPMLII